MSGLLRRWMRVGIVSLVGGAAVAAGLGMTPVQFGGPVLSNLPIRTGRAQPPADEEPIVTQEIQKTQNKRLIAQRQQEVFDDTAKLLQLATDLKAEVDKGDHDMLPVAAMKDADEIGKLAKRVSDKMKAQ